MIDWDLVAAPLVVAVGAAVALLIDAFIGARSWKWPSLASGAALVLAAGELVGSRGSGGPDELSLGLSLVIVLGTLMVLLSAAVMDHEDSMPPGELHFLLLASASGAMCMVVARDFVTLIVALELLSLPSIAMVGLRRGDTAAARGAWTFFLVSVVSTAVTLMGISLIYGFAGSLGFADVNAQLRGSAAPDRAIVAAVVITVVGLLFKIGAVPFHMWIPDTYRGASIPVAAYLSVVSKAGAVGALIVVLGVPFGAYDSAWAPMIAAVAALTMTVGNIGAFVQRDAVGVLAWSSIAQAGFILAPIVALGVAGGARAAVQYLAIYALANLVAFTMIALVRRRWGGTSFRHLTGLARRDPLGGACLSLALLTLAGFPPAVIGLVAKYAVLRPVVEAGYGWLAVVMAANVALGLAYYLPMMARVLSQEGDEITVVEPSPSPPYAVGVARTSMVLGTLALIATSVYPNLILAPLR